MTSSEGSPSLSILNHPPTKIPGPCLLHDLVRRQSDQGLPAIDALLGDGSRCSFSYDELHSASDALALQILSATRHRIPSCDFIIPLLIPQCPQLYVAQLAVLKAGGAFCPLQLDAPPERIKFILEDVHANVLLITPEVASRIPLLDPRICVLTIPGNTAVAASGPKQDGPLVESSPEDLAYVMYTSGSTGTPKGVAISHGAATQSLLAHDRHIPAFKRFLQFAAPTFDVSVFEIFFPLFRGRTLVSCDRGVMLDDLPTAMNCMSVDACELTPTVAGSLLRTREGVPTLSLLLTIGEMLTDKVVTEFGGDDETPSLLWGMYGPTEAAIHCTLQPAFVTGSSRNTIGFPLDTVSCFIARIPEAGENYAFEPLPLGDTGELVVGGFQLAREYLNREAQTNEAFIQTCFGRLYRTGDRARLRADSVLECLGRISDGQVKLRGQRIELGEIEQVISRHPGCQGVAALVIQGILVAFCTADPTHFNLDTQAFSESILQTCRAWLPEFMVPGDLVRIDEFPRLPSGKVDRHELSRAYLATRSTTEDDDAHDPLVVQVVEAASELLGMPVGSQHALSGYGLDSLKAIRLASHLRARGIKVAALDILQARSINIMCESILKGPPPPTSNPLLTNASANSARPLLTDRTHLAGLDILSAHPCTVMQSAMLFESANRPGAYFNSIELQFPADCSADLAKQALQHLAQSNNILRSGFVRQQEGFVRVVLGELDAQRIEIVDAYTPFRAVDLESDLLQPFRAQVLMPMETRGPRVLLRLHHALYDGWSVDLMTTDLSLAICGRKPRSRPQFEEVSSFYESVPPTLLNESRSYWAEHLYAWQPMSFPRLLDKSSAHSTSAVYTIRLNTTLGEAANASQRLGCHPQVIFQAALLWLWGQVMGTEDVVIGTIASGRTIPVDDIDQIMGPCITPAPLRVNMATLGSSTHLIRSIQTINRTALRHSMLPLSAIRKSAGIPTGQALYDTLLVYQETLYSQDRHSRPVRETSHCDSLETKLLIEIEPVESGFHCQLTYQTDFLSEQEVRVFAEQFDAVTHHLTTEPSVSLGEIHQCLPSDLTSVSNVPPSSFEGVPDLATMFESVVATSPDVPAIYFANSITGLDADAEILSYCDLNRISNQMAQYLRYLGVVEGAPIAVIMDKSTRMYAAILAAVKAGCSYLPLLPSTPVGRINDIMEQASVPVCFVDRNSLALVGGSQACTVVDVESMDFSSYPMETPQRRIDGSRPAYLIYTSGTTGVPKGIIVTQLNITSNLDVLSKIYPIDGSCRFLQLCSQAFDVSVFEIFFTWVTGNTLCSGTNDVLFENIERTIQVLGCTHLSLTPTVAALVHPQNVPAVRFLVTAGEPMTDRVAKEWCSKLYQGYGPAETTNICTVKKMGEADHIHHLGFPLDNTSCFVLSPDSDRIAPLGAYGELCFGGDQVATGYLALPDVTDSKFISHPINGRLYRSGDMGRMLPDRSLVISGRLDGQVKLRGQRIETSELDTIITSSGATTSAASMIGQHRKAQGAQLVSFYVPTGYESGSFQVLPLSPALSACNDRLFGLLQSRVPAYMVPTFLVPITYVPLTSSGKIDKRRLLAKLDSQGQEYLQSVASSDRATSESAEWSTTEMQVALSVSQALGVSMDSLSRWMSLTAVGLDSISVIGLCQQMESAVGTRISISSVLRDPRIACIAQLVNELGRRCDSTIPTAQVELPTFAASWVQEISTGFAQRSQAIESILPCTALQQGMLSAVQTESYTSQLVFRLRLPSSTMKLAWETLVQRHGILRTCFFTTAEASQPFAQVILTSYSMPWTESGHSSASGTTKEVSGTLFATVDSYTVPYRLAIREIGGEEFLTFICHHALYDGESIRIMLRDLEHIILGVPLPDPVPYEPFLRHSMTVSAAAPEFWRKTFNGFSPSVRQLELSSKVAPCTVIKTSPVSFGDVQLVAQTCGASLLSVCQAAWAITLRLVFKDPDICFGNVVSGRTIPVAEVESLAAPCFNTIPVRALFQDDKLTADLFQELRRLNADALEFQFTPLRMVQRILNATRSLFDTILLLQFPQEKLNPSIWELVEDSGAMDVPLVCELVPAVETNTISVILHSRTHQVSDLDAVAELLMHVLIHVCKYPGATIPQEAEIPSELLSRVKVVPPAHGPRDRILASQNIEGLPSTSDQELWSVTEQSIRTVLAQLSSTPEQRIHRNMTIFQLGLDSINAVQVARLLRHQHLAVSALDVINSPSCAALGRLLELRNDRPVASFTSYDLSKFRNHVESKIRTDIRSQMTTENILPCTPVQCGMLSDFVRSHGQDYFNFISFLLEEEIQLETLQQAWRCLVRHHPILRTGFVAVDHPDTTFAMVQYSSTLSAALHLHDSNDPPFDGSQWRVKCSQEVVLDISYPPWRVCLEQSNGEIRMHLAILHALYDGESIRILLEDFHTFLLGQTPAAATPNDETLSAIIGEALDETHSKRFWEEMAPGVVVNRFPTLTPLMEPTSELAVHTQISRLDLETLQTGAMRSGASVLAVLQAGWARILSAYLGEPDVVFGAVLSGRTSEGSERATIPVITTLPVVSNTVLSNHELVHQMLEYNTKLLPHQHTSLARVQRWLGHPHGRLFDSLLVYQKPLQRDSRVPPWRIIHDEGRLDYALSLEVEPKLDGSVQLRLSFQTGVLPRQQASILVDQFDSVLEELISPPRGNIHEPWKTNPGLFSIAPPLESTIPAEEILLHQFVERAALRWPSRTAVEFVSSFQGEIPQSQTWTFQQLDQMGNRVARTISGCGCQGRIVAIHFEKSPEALFSILGILKAGFCFLALDPSAPRDRKEFILQDSGAAALLTGDEAIDFHVGCPVIQISPSSLSGISSEPIQTQQSIDPGDACYCLYTSGTTGTPKGCEITHDNAVQAMKSFQRLFEGHWDDQSRWLQFASFHFDVTILEQYWSWSVGIPLIAAPRDVILDDIAAAIRRLRITHIDLTPSLARLLDPEDVPSLCKGVFITGGEALKQEILDTWGPYGVIYNAYGPTEATIGVTMYQRVPKNGRASNIGRQFDNVGSYVLQPGTDIPVWRGAIGELCISGSLVGKGYLNRQELTRERFPTLAGFGERVYRTGDLVRLLHDGCFEFLGRADDQVKLRGQRLEIGEINHVIRAGVIGIHDVVTLVTKHPTMEKDLLVSFITSNRAARSHGDPVVIHGSTASEYRKAVQRACRAKLPGYMVPTFVFQLSFIPLSINNKADLKSLKRVFNTLDPAQLLQLSSNQDDTLIPLTSIQNEVLKVTERFGNPDLGLLSMSTNLFDLGLDSISSLKLARLFKEHGLKGATPSLILRNPVLMDLADALDTNRHAIEAGNFRESQQYIQAFDHRFRAQILQETSMFSAEDIEYVAPCTPLQEGMLSNALALEESAYFVRFRLRLLNNISSDRFKMAWEKLVAEHSILRTQFIQTSGGFAQVALRNMQACWRETSCVEANIDTLLDRLFIDWKQRNRQALVCPLELAVVTTTSYTLVAIHIFHAIYDGASLELMLDWVSQENRRIEHRPVPSFVDAMPYGPARNLESTRSFWEAHLEGCSYEALPRRAGSSRNGFHTASREFTFTDLASIRKSHSVTLQSLVLSLWAVAFSKHFSKQAAIGVVCSGRSLELQDADRIIGPLFNTLPFFPNVGSHQSWASLIQRSHDFNTAILQFQHVPLRSIQKWCAQGRAVIESLFVFQLDTASASERQNAPWVVEEGLAESEYPLAFEVTADGTNRLHVRVVAHDDIADIALSHRLLDDFGEAIQSLAAHQSSTSDPPSVIISEMTSLVPTPRTHGSSGSVSRAHSTGHSTPDTSSFTFEWTPETSALRQEISSLSKVPQDQISATTTLLELGLDSIDIVTLVSRMKVRGCHITLPKLMKARNIAEAGKLIETTHSTSIGTGWSEFEATKARLWQEIKKGGWDMRQIEVVLPPTSLQESMVADMLESGFDRYFNHATFEVLPGTNVQKFVGAWSQVILQSPILRTVFRQINDVEIPYTFCQVVLRDNMSKVDSRRLHGVEDISSVTADHKRRAMIANGASALLQLSIVYVEDKTYLVLSMAHALYDGWSLALLHQDIESAYHDVLTKRPPPEATLRSLLEAPSDQARLFWSQYLNGASPSLVPETPTKVIVPDNHGEAVSSLSLDEVTSFCKSQSVSLQILAQACWASVLASRLRSLDVTFGVVLSGRETEEAQALMYPTMNTVAIRCVLHGSKASFLQYLQESMAHVYQHQSFPLRAAQSAGGRASGRLFNTLFLLQKQPETVSSGSKALLKPVFAKATTDFAVCAELEVVGALLNWTVASKEGSYNAVEVQDIVLSLDQALRSFINSPDSGLIDFDNELISICGLTSFRLPDKSASGSHEAAVEAHDSSQDWSPVEDIIRKAFSLVSGVATESITKGNSPYHLGLDSISLIKVSAILREQGLSLSVKTLLTLPSISDLARLASSDGSITPRQEVVACSISPRAGVESLMQTFGLFQSAIEDVLPALPMQVFMMTIWEKTGGAVFFPTFRYNLKQRVSMDDLREAWKTTVEAEPILRTCILPTGNRETPFLQFVLQKDCDGPHKEVFEKLHSEPVSPMAGWPLVRLSAQSSHDAHWELGLKIHHALYDAVSLPALLTRFENVLARIEFNNSPTQMTTWKAFLGHHQSPGAIASRRTFWTQYLNEVSTRDHIGPLDHHTTRTSYLDSSALHNMSLVKAFCSSHGLGFSALLLAAVARCWFDQNQGSQTHVVLGVYLANRGEEVSAQIGTFPALNILPCKVCITTESHLVDLATSIQRDLLQITDSINSTAGLWEINDWTGITADVFVNFLNFPGDATPSGMLEPITGLGDIPSPVPLKSYWAANDLVHEAFPDVVDIEAGVRGDSLAIGIFGSEKKVSLADAQEIVARMADILNGVLA